MAAVKFSDCAEDPPKDERESPACDPIELLSEDMLVFFAP